MPIEKRGTYKAERRRHAKSLRHILVDKGECIAASHTDLKALHILGHNTMQPKFLPDGTALTDLGGVTTVIMPDGRLAAVFHPNPQNIMPTIGKSDSQYVAQPENNYPKLTSAEGLTVLGMRLKAHAGLDPDWTMEAYHKFDALMTDSFTDFGLLIRTDKNKWRSQSVEYEITAPTKRKHRKNLPNEKGQSILNCRYGMSIDAVQETKGNQHVSYVAKAHRAISRFLRTDWASFDEANAYVAMLEHFGKITEKVQQGFSPHKETFNEGNESQFSQSIIDRQDHRNKFTKARSKVIFLMAGIVSTVIGTVSTIASGIANSTSDYTKKNLQGAARKLATTALAKRAMTLGGGATLLFSNFLLRTMNAAALQTSRWLNLNKENIAYTAYKYLSDPKVRKRLFQEGDPEQFINAKTLSLEEYDISEGIESHVNKIPKQYILNRLFNTKAIGNGAEMEAFEFGNQKVVQYTERSGVERARVPLLDVAYVSASNANLDEDWGLMDETKDYLKGADVLKIWKDKRGKLHAKSMTHNEYQIDLERVTQKSSRSKALEHPDADAFKKGWAAHAEAERIAAQEAIIKKYKERANAPHRQVLKNL